MLDEEEKARKEMGLRIAQRREILHISQTQLAEMCDVSPNTITSIETGKTGARFDTFRKLAIALRCSADYLMFGENQPSEKKDKLDAMCDRVRATLSPKKLDGFVKIMSGALELAKD